MFCSQNLGGVLNVALSLRGLQVLLRTSRGGQGFAAFGRKFERPPPSGCFLTPYLILTFATGQSLPSQHDEECNEIAMVRKGPALAQLADSVSLDFT